MSKSPISQILQEQGQAPETRRPLIRAMEEFLGLPVVTFYTSFTHPVSIEANDADMLEQVLQQMDLDEGLALVLSSPGGDGLAAEKIIRVCRSYTGTGKFLAIVPSKAKSAATLVCMGAHAIVMGPTSELGPVDPQIAERVRDDFKWLSVHNIVESYDRLFAEARQEQGRLEPYLQQLSHYDPREIAEYRTAIRLSEDIAVQALSSGMLQGQDDESVRHSVELFLRPQQGKVVHGRAIHRKEVEECGLQVERWEVHQEKWNRLYELHVRTNHFVTNQASKCIETRETGLFAGLPESARKR